MKITRRKALALASALVAVPLVAGTASAAIYNPSTGQYMAARSCGETAKGEVTYMVNVFYKVSGSQGTVTNIRVTPAGKQAKDTTRFIIGNGSDRQSSGSFVGPAARSLPMAGVSRTFNLNDPKYRVTFEDPRTKCSIQFTSADTAVPVKATKPVPTTKPKPVPTTKPKPVPTTKPAATMQPAPTTKAPAPAPRPTVVPTTAPAAQPKSVVRTGTCSYGAMKYNVTVHSTTVDGKKGIVEKVTIKDVSTSSNRPVVATYTVEGGQNQAKSKFFSAPKGTIKEGAMAVVPVNKDYGYSDAFVRVNVNPGSGTGCEVTVRVNQP